MIQRTLVLLALALSGCSKGPHVSVQPVYVTKYACWYSDSVFRADRRVAICDTEAECNAICEKLPK